MRPSLLLFDPVYSVIQFSISKGHPMAKLISMNNEACKGVVGRSDLAG